MRAGLLLPALGLAAAGAAAQPTPFDGDWTMGNPANCAIGMDHADFAFRIGGGQMQGIESVCRMTNPVPVRDLGATLYDMDCQGEGERWSYRNFLMLNREGALVMINDGDVTILARCTGYLGPTGPSSPPRSK